MTMVSGSMGDRRASRATHGANRHVHQAAAGIFAKAIRDESSLRRCES
ncbi:hypothetical protein [Pseudoxanthomonas yeongjuensis]|jgi:hypothetical protein|nr:hypothetical protein [Pseudoxanthomonas yeongjuensis]